MNSIVRTLNTAIFTRVNIHHLTEYFQASGTRNGHILARYTSELSGNEAINPETTYT